MTAKYTYERNCPDGVFDRLAIVGPEGEVIANLYYWDEPDTDEAKRVEKAARIICKHLNHWWHGMDDCRVLTPDEVREHEGQAKDQMARTQTQQIFDRQQKP